MNILTVNKFYYVKGGSETYLFALEKLMKNNGHKIIPFAMQDERNEKTEYNKYFVKNVDYNKMSFMKKVYSASKLIYSIEAYRNMKQLLENENIELAHLHIFQHQLSPSILFPLKNKNIPVIYTVHDLKVMCPNYKMMTSNEVCERCQGNKFYNVLINKCVKDSYAASTISMLEAYTHRVMKIYQNYIDHFITPSQFYRNKMINWGYPSEKITFIPNFVDVDKYTPNYKHENYYLYLGRLSEEKGLQTLLKSIPHVQTNFKLVIAGTGPLEKEIMEFIKNNRLENCVELTGFISGDKLKQVIQNAKCVIMPSEWYENGPLALIESFAYGKPVIGSDIGGIPEHIDHGVNGLVFKAKDFIDLASKIDCVNGLESEELIKMGENAREKAEIVYSSTRHAKRLTEVYDRILNNRIGLISSKGAKHS